MSELKCCPFCGGEAKVHDCQVICIKCYSGTAVESNTNDAIRLWNTRKPLDNIVENIVESLESEKTVFLGTRTEQTDTILIDEAINIVKQEINNGLE